MIEKNQTYSLGVWDYILLKIDMAKWRHGTTYTTTEVHLKMLLVIHSRSFRNIPNLTRPLRYNFAHCCSIIWLPSGTCINYFESIIFKHIIQNSSFDTRCKMVLGWMPRNLTNEKSKLFPLMVSWRQATSPYLGWPKSVSPYGVTKSE